MIKHNVGMMVNAKRHRKKKAKNLPLMSDRYWKPAGPRHNHFDWAVDDDRCKGEMEGLRAS